MAEAEAAAAPLPGLAARVGMPLVSPRAAFELVERAGGRAGLGDATTLLVLEVLCLEARTLVVAVWTMLSVGFGAGFASLGPPIQRAIGLDLLLLVGGGVFVTLAAGRRRRPGRDFDLAAVAWVPHFALSLAASLVAQVAGWRPSPAAGDLLGWVGLAVYAGMLGLAVRHARSRPGAEVAT